MMQLYKYAFSMTGPVGPDKKALVQVGVPGKAFDYRHTLPSLKDPRTWSYAFDEGSEVTGVLYTEGPLF